MEKSIDKLLLNKSTDKLLKDFEKAKSDFMDTVGSMLAIMDLITECLKPIKPDSLREGEKPIKSQGGKNGKG